MKTRNVGISCWLLMLFFCTFGVVGAAAYDSAMTDQLFNGYMWQLLNDSQKITHLTGIQEGIKLCLSQIKDDLQIPPALMQSMRESGLFERRRLLFSTQGVSGILSRIDGFYRDAANLNIPIVEAYRHVTLILNFSDGGKVADDLARLKRKYQK